MAPTGPPGDDQDSWPEILGGFPRHLTRDLLQQEQDSRSRKRVFAGWLFGLALALVALAFPQERLVGPAFAEVFERPAIWNLWERVHGTFAGLLGLRAEQLRFVTSALAYGACVPAALALGRRLGCPFALSVAASAVVLAAPGAWIAGTTPGVGSAALLLLLLLMSELWRPGERRPWRLLLLWAGLALLDDGLLLLWPALFLACRRPDGLGGERRRPARFWWLAGLAVVALVTAVELSTWDPVPMPSRMELDGGRLALDARVLQRLASALPGLGLALAGLASLAFLRRDPSEEPPPRWLWAWAGFPLLFLALHSALGWDAACLWLLPVALLGLLDLFARLDAGPAPLLAVGGLALQLAFVVAANLHLDRTDPAREWREHAREFLRPKDVLITGHAEHSYLASHRWGLRSVVLRAAEPEAPDPARVEGVYADEAARTNLRVKTQDAWAWADEGIEAHALGFGVVLDRPFREPSDGIAQVIEEALEERVEHFVLRVPPIPGEGRNPRGPGYP